MGPQWWRWWDGGRGGSYVSSLMLAETLTSSVNTIQLIHPCATVKPMMFTNGNHSLCCEHFGKREQKRRLPFGNQEAWYRIRDLHWELSNWLEVRGGASISGGSWICLCPCKSFSTSIAISSGVARQVGFKTFFSYLWNVEPVYILKEHCAVLDGLIQFYNWTS